MGAQNVLCCSALLTILLLSIGTHCKADNAETKFAIELTSDSFNVAIQENNHFVMFFAPWCGHCKRLHPLWEELASLMNVVDRKVTIAKVDCTEHQELCKKHEITGYPTLRLFKLGEELSVKFKGTRDMPAITEFINQQLLSEEDLEYDEEKIVPEPPTQGKVVELTEDSFAKHVSSGNHFVKFYAPWCSHCQRLAPTWDELSKTLHIAPTVSISKIDCTVHRPICQSFEVKGYPTLLWIEDGKKIEKYSGSREHDSLKEYVEKMLGADIKQSPPIADEKLEVAIQADKQGQVMQLTGDDFQNNVAEGVTFVKFYAPWCGHCQKLSPTWDQLAEKVHALNNGIKIAKVDCTTTENKQLCVDEQVEGYPTLYAYKNGEKQSEYDGNRSLPELQHYISKYVSHDEL